MVLGFWLVWQAEELDTGLLDRQLDPPIDELAEGLVGGEALFDLIGAVGPNEATNRFAVMDVGELVVWTMTLRMLRVHASASGSTTDLILHRNASRVHWPEFQ